MTKKIPLSRLGKSETSDTITSIRGIGKTFEKDFLRIGISKISDLKGKSPEKVFEKLKTENRKVGHETTKLYLYVIRMVVYVADGGKDSSLLHWSKWKD
jgi:hypothetical protein